MRVTPGYYLATWACHLPPAIRRDSSRDAPRTSIECVLAYFSIRHWSSSHYGDGIMDLAPRPFFSFFILLYAYLSAPSKRRTDTFI
ncbi:hypothetical protein GGI42DRAFT_324924 [Trichoderma sp. SZMC 28013]